MHIVHMKREKPKIDEGPTEFCGRYLQVPQKVMCQGCEVELSRQVAAFGEFSQDCPSAVYQDRVFS